MAFDNYVPNIIMINRKITFRTRGDPIRTNSVLCPIKDNFFKFEEFVLGKDYSGRVWENLLFGLSTTESQPFSPKISDHITNYLYCGTNCNSEDGFGEDLAARNIQRGRDHGIPGITCLTVIYYIHI